MMALTDSGKVLAWKITTDYEVGSYETGTATSVTGSVAGWIHEAGTVLMAELGTETTTVDTTEVGTLDDSTTATVLETITTELDGNEVTS
jgi:hypothetical protein